MFCVHRLGYALRQSTLSLLCVALFFGGVLIMLGHMQMDSIAAQAMFGPVMLVAVLPAWDMLCMNDDGERLRIDLALRVHSLSLIIFTFMLVCLPISVATETVLQLTIIAALGLLVAAFYIVAPNRVTALQPLTEALA